MRKEVSMYPELSVRELVANAIIHQDLTLRGTGPMIEIFADRMEITNPGIPLVNTERFLDSPPRSRNESLAPFMRRVGICEERDGNIYTRKKRDVIPLFSLNHYSILNSFFLNIKVLPPITSKINPTIR